MLLNIGFIKGGKWNEADFNKYSATHTTGAVCAWLLSIHSHWSPWGQSSPGQWAGRLWGRFSGESIHKEDPSEPGKQRDGGCPVFPSTLTAWWFSNDVKTASNWLLFTFLKHILVSKVKDIFPQYLWDDDESESEAKKHQVHSVHPAQEDEVGGHRRAKVTWMETGIQLSPVTCWGMITAQEGNSLSTSLIFRSQGMQAVRKFSKSRWNLIHFWDWKTRWTFESIPFYSILNSAVFGGERRLLIMWLALVIITL